MAKGKKARQVAAARLEEKLRTKRYRMPKAPTGLFPGITQPDEDSMFEAVEATQAGAREMMPFVTLPQETVNDNPSVACGEAWRIVNEASRQVLVAREALGKLSDDVVGWIRIAGAEQPLRLTKAHVAKHADQLARDIKKLSEQVAKRCPREGLIG